MQAVGGFTGEHVVFEFGTRGAGAIAFEVRLIAGEEFGFIGADTAVGAG